MPFVDEAKIYVAGGHGGKGCRSFDRSPYFRHPKPNGGNGGRGGNIVVVADNKIHTLLDYKYQQHFSAPSGGHGSSNNKQGRDGEDCIIKVPLGTSVKDFETGYLLRDLEEHEQKVIAANGGIGGLGNNNSRIVSEGKPGEQKTLTLELKLIADVGIVGFPNAGKSTLISCLTNARPKVASYPFTTKAPVLGNLEIDGTVMTIADLPGLIEGAHEGRGLGDKFLKHVEKTRLLIHLVDVSGVESDPVKNYQSLNKELKFYSADLSQKKQIIVA
ncbi:MAG: GTPase ObgE, partial [Candidatus Omnitrophica bacterium]|nr:GTPase ObgE [Candidatus Omnitrophota bacterium]